MCNESDAALHGQLLVWSNASYVLPAGVALYRTLYTHSLAPEACAELLPWYLSVAFVFSWSYHACKSELAKSGTIDPCQSGREWSVYGPCKTCPPTGLQYSQVPYDRSSTLDRVFANYAVLLSLMHALPLTPLASQLFRTLGLIWVATSFLISDTYSDELAFLALLPLTVMIFVFWIYTWQNQQRRMTWAVAMLLSGGAIAGLYSSSYYFLTHSMWHISGAMAGALILSAGADPRHDELKHIKVGKRTIWT
jgi:hypothetical protein